MHGRRVSSLEKSLFLKDRDHGRELSCGSMLRQHAQKVTHPDQGLLDRAERSAETGDSLWRSDWLLIINVQAVFGLSHAWGRPVRQGSPSLNRVPRERVWLVVALCG